jgi:hypothetical protein
MVNLMIHNHKKPGPALALRIAEALTDKFIEQEGLRFFLLRKHKAAAGLMEEFPNAFEDFRTAGNRKDDKGLRIH